LINIINRSKITFPLLAYELANITANDSNVYFKIFGQKGVKKRSEYFYSTICHEQLSFWCNDFHNLDTITDVVINVEKADIKGTRYKIPDINKYLRDYSLFKVSYNSKLRSNSVFFARGIKDVYKGILFLPLAFYTEDCVYTIRVTKFKLKKKDPRKLIYFKPKGTNCNK
jgi:hypothetical protein